MSERLGFFKGSASLKDAKFRRGEHSPSTLALDREERFGDCISGAQFMVENLFDSEDPIVTVRRGRAGGAEFKVAILSRAQDALVQSYLPGSNFTRHPWFHVSEDLSAEVQSRQDPFVYARKRQGVYTPVDPSETRPTLLVCLLDDPRVFFDSALEHYGDRTSLGQWRSAMDASRDVLQSIS